MPDLSVAVSTHKALVEWIRAAFPDQSEDELADTIEGQATLDEAIFATLRDAWEREAHADALGAMIEQMTARKRRLETAAQTLRNAALMAMQGAGWKKLTAPDMTVSVNAGRPKLVITGEVPRLYSRVKTEPDKTAIKAALDEGAKLDFATLSNGAPVLTVRRA